MFMSDPRTLPRLALAVIALAFLAAWIWGCP
jgi:hypothetical protein